MTYFLCFIFAGLLNLLAASKVLSLLVLLTSKINGEVPPLLKYKIAYFLEEEVNKINHTQNVGTREIPLHTLTL